MPLYYYKAVTRNGQLVRNKVEDKSRINLMRKLKRNGLTPIVVMQTAKRKRKSRRPMRNARNMDQIVKNIGVKVEVKKKQTF